MPRRLHRDPGVFNRPCYSPRDFLIGAAIGVALYLFFDWIEVHAAAEHVGVASIAMLILCAVSIIENLAARHLAEREDEDAW